MWTTEEDEGIGIGLLELFPKPPFGELGEQMHKRWATIFMWWVGEKFCRFGYYEGKLRLGRSVINESNKDMKFMT